MVTFTNHVAPLNSMGKTLEEGTPKRCGRQWWSLHVERVRARRKWQELWKPSFSGLWAHCPGMTPRNPSVYWSVSIRANSFSPTCLNLPALSPSYGCLFPVSCVPLHFSGAGIDVSWASFNPLQGPQAQQSLVTGVQPRSGEPSLFTVSWYRVMCQQILSHLCKDTASGRLFDTKCSATASLFYSISRLVIGVCIRGRATISDKISFSQTWIVYTLSMY